MPKVSITIANLSLLLNLLATMHFKMFFIFIKYRNLSKNLFLMFTVCDIL